jgi:hypothetical protein
MLHTQGYEIVRSAITVSDDELSQLKGQVRSMRHIFNAKRNDRRRKQAPIRASNKLVRRVRDLLKVRYPLLTPANAVLLRSEAECEDQMPHCDYEQNTKFALIDDSYIPLGVVVAIEPGTKLHVWPNSIRHPSRDTTPSQPIRRETIDIDVGDILIFRGDLTHAGASYGSTNHRVHIYVDSPMVKRTRNRTHLMDRVWYIQ